MKKISLFLLLGWLAPMMAGAATTCSQTTLRRCLDSACAINIGANPAARCQYCGRASAGGVPTNTTLKNVSVGAKGALSDKELKNAPTDDPGRRYVWATTECLKKVAGCTADDVTDMYDPLIQASCDAADLDATLTGTLTTAHTEKTQGSCNTDILACMMGDNRCGADLTGCADDAAFDNAFATCSVERGNGCNDFVTAIRSDIASQRDQAIADAENAITRIVNTYQTARAEKLAAAQSTCTNNVGREECIQNRCAQNMPNKCADGFAGERAMATLLCKYYELACDRLKK